MVLFIYEDTMAGRNFRLKMSTRILKSDFVFYQEDFSKLSYKV